MTDVAWIFARGFAEELDACRIGRVLESFVVSQLVSEVFSAKQLVDLTMVSLHHGLKL